MNEKKLLKPTLPPDAPELARECPFRALAGTEEIPGTVCAWRNDSEYCWLFNPDNNKWTPWWNHKDGIKPLYDEPFQPGERVVVWGNGGDENGCAIVIAYYDGAERVYENIRRDTGQPLLVADLEKEGGDAT